MDDKPERIFADDGETPYFYEPDEEVPPTAVEYVRADVAAAEVERLRAALRPFADAAARAEARDAPYDDAMQIWSVGGITNTVVVTFGHLRRARAALRGEEG